MNKAVTDTGPVTPGTETGPEVTHKMDAVSKEAKKVQYKETLIYMFKDLEQIKNNMNGASDTLRAGDYEGADFAASLAVEIEALQNKIVEKL